MKSYKLPLLTVDCVVFYYNNVLLITRKNSPFKNSLALPGGFVDLGESVEDACVRELFEETNLRLDPSELKLVGVYSSPGRDPRRDTVTIAYCAHIKDNINIIAGDDAASVEFVKNWNEKKLAFDHLSIINDAHSRCLNE